MKVWLDDVRKPPEEDYIWAENSFQMFTLLDNHWDEISEVDLDNDLGESIEGYEIIKEIERRIFQDNKKPFIVYIHTANVAVYKKMNEIAIKINSLC